MFTPRWGRALAVPCSFGIVAFLNIVASGQTLSSAPSSNLGTDALTLNWSSTFPGGTLYYAQLSTNASFAAPILSSNTLNISATFSGLTPNTTYYAQVATAPAGPFTALGSTVTWVQVPTSVYFDEVSSHSIVAAAYAPAPAFSNLNVGVSGTNIAIGGVYAGWHGEAWVTKAAMPGARYGLGAAAAGGRLYAVGGYNASPLTTNAEYDPASNAWAAKTALPAAANAPGVAAADGAVYLAGGEDAGGLLATMRRYDPASNSWTSLAAMPSSRAGHAFFHINGRLHSVGGIVGPVYTDSNVSFDPRTGAWTSRGALPFLNHAMGAAVSRSMAYLIGGSNGATLSSAAVYNTGGDSWVSVSSAPVASANPTLAAVGGKLYLIGGQSGGGAALSLNHEYDPSTDAWTPRASMPTARHRAGAAVVGGRVYVVGGTNGSALSVNEQYDPGTASSFAGLSPNTQYSFKAKARNLAGVETDETSTVSTYTWAAVPLAATPTFTGVFIDSVAVAWTANGNPGGTEYRLHASTAPDFNGSAASATGPWTTALSATASGLASGTDWHFRVQARNAVGVETAYAALGSTATLPPGSVKVWDGGGATNLASEAANWVGDAVPAAGDSVWFGPASAKDCTWNSVVSLSSMTLAAGYEGTVTLSTNVTVGGDLTVSSGTLVAPAGGTVVTVLGRIMRMAPSSILWQTGRLRLAGDLVLNAVNTTAVFGSTLEFNGSAYQVVYGTGSGVLPALDINSSSKVYFNRQGGGVSFTGGVFLRAGVLDLGGQMMFETYGPWVQTGGQFAAAQSTVIFYGGSAAAPWTVTSLPGNPFFNLRIGALPQAAYPGHLQAAVPLDMDGSVIISSGSFDPGSFTHTVGGDWMHIGGDFLASTGTIRLDGAAATRVILASGGRFSALDVVKSATTTFTAGVSVSSLSFSQSAGTLSFQAGSTATVGRLILGTPGLAQRLTLRSTSAGTPWRLVVQSTAAVWRTAVSDSDASGGLTVRARLGDSLDGGGNVNWEFDSVSPGALSGVSTGTLSASWTSTFPGGTVYLLQASTSASFAAPLLSSATAALAATFAGLSANATYHVRVAADPSGPFVSLGSTHTWVQAPTGVYFDEISSHSLVVSAYAPTPAFSNLGSGLSGTNVAKDGVYAGWHGERWTTKAAMPTARYAVRAAAVDGRIYAVGGYNAGNLATNAEYDPAADAWVAKAAMPTARHSFAVGALNGKLYAVGGESTAALSVNQEYDPATNAWATKTSLPSARMQTAAVAFDGKLHLFGGHNGTSVIGLHDAYDPATNAWETKTSLPDARQAPGAERVGGKAYVFGGEASSILAFNREFDFGVNSWVTKSTMPTARVIMAHGVIGGKVYAVAGKIGSPPGTAVTEEYDPAADTWTARTPSPTGREWVGSAVVSGRLYVIGGSNGTPLAVNEEYDPGVAQRFAGLQPNTLYAFKAKARNQGGLESAETASFSTYTLAALPGAPTFAAVGTGTLTLQWTANGNPAGTEFQAELSSAAAFSAPALAGWTADMTSAVFAGLPSGTTWYGRVRSRNAVGVSGDYVSAASTRTAYAAPAGCAVTRDVGKSGAPYGTITAALAAVPASLTAETCVVVRDTSTYVEQVTVTNKATNGFRLRILRDPALTSHPTVQPPAASTAAFQVQAASVSIEGLRAAPVAAVGWAILVSSPNVLLSGVLVQSTATIVVAGLQLDAFGRVEDSTVSVGNTTALYLPTLASNGNVVARSSFTNGGTTTTVTLAGWDNMITGSFIVHSNLNGAGLVIGDRNVLERSSVTAPTAVAFNAGSSSSTISRSYLQSYFNPAVYLRGSFHTVDRSTLANPSAVTNALAMVNVTHSTVSLSILLDPFGTALGMADSHRNLIADSKLVRRDTGYTMTLTRSSDNAIVRTTVENPFGKGILVTGPGSGTAIVSSTVTALLEALELNSAVGHSIIGSHIYSANATALAIDDSSTGTVISQSRLVSQAAAGYALYLTTATATLVSQSLVENTSGYAAFFAAKADGNTFDLSTVTARVSGYSALYLDNASTNTFTRSYFGNAAGNGVTFGAGASSNTLSRSTVASSGAAARALSLFMALDSYVYDSWLLGAGYGAYAELSSRALILRSTVTGLGAVPGFMVAGSSGVVLRDSYVQGSDAVNVYSSTATAVENSTLKAAGGSGKALQFLQGSNGLSLASATLSAAAVGLLVEDGSRGPLALSSFSVTASTGLQFTGGTQVTTVSLAGFPAGTAVNVDASGLSSASRVTMRDATGGRAGTLYETDPLGLVDWLPDENPVVLPGPFSSLSSNSFTASWTSGFPAGTLYYARASTDSAFGGTVLSSDTFAVSASFSGLPPLTTYYARVATASAGPFTALGSTRTSFGDLPGCATSKFVQKAGGADCASIGACVALIPSTPLTGDFCIAVLDSAVYSEQVTVAGKNPNGFRIRLWGAGGARPTLTPPAGSSAGFRLMTASVSVSEINVITTNTVTYGVLASSASVSLSSMIIDSGGRISGAGVFLSSWGVVQNASVTVQNADGFRLTGTGNTVSASSASVTVFGRAAYYLGTASSNTISDSYGSGNPGYGAFVYHSHGNTFARTTLRKLSATAGAAGLYLNDASSNTVTGCFISNAGGPGADLSSSVNYNLIELSTITAAGNVYTALELGFAKGNRISRVYVHSDNGSGSTLSSGASETLVENSTFSTYYSGAAALSTNGSSDTLSGNMLYAPNGIGLGVFGSSVTTRRNAAFTGSPSFAALYVAGGGYVSVHDSSFENSAGDGGKLERTSYVDILRSTVSGAGGGAGLKLEGASSNTVTASRLAAPGGVGMALGSYLELFDMTTTTGTGNVLRDLIVSGSTAVSLGASPGLEVSSSVLTGDAQGAAIAFGDAVLVATFTGLAFPSGSAVSADATLLPSGSRITIRDASGPQAGSLYESDPLSLVDWVPDLVPFVLPPAPAAPSGTVLGTSSIAWTWGPVAGAQSYRVYSSSSGSLLAASASTGAVVTDLLAATTNSIVVAGVARGENGPLSASATAHTHASPPAGLSLDILYVSSAVLSWSLEDNPSETLAELQRSTDGASYSVRAGTLAPSAEDTGLLGCTSYYYRVRHKNPAGVGSAFDGPLLVRTAASTPSAPGDLSAQSVPGRRVALSWSGSLTEGVVAYRLYKDTGAGAVDYSAPYATFGPTTFSTTTVALSSGAIHLFGLRALHRCGIEEANTHAVASAWALETLDGVRASIKVPATGKKISGNRVLVMAELDTGSSSDVSSILFQYRSTGTAAWTDIPAANANHPNPDREQPFFVHWDVSALADRAYDLRAVASDVVGASDPAPGTITVLVDSVGFEVRETDLGAGRVKKEQAVSNETSNTVAAAGSGSAVVTKVILPAGALNTADATLSATPNPAALPAPPAAATSLGASIEITLSNGQSQLSNGQTAAIVFNYPDDDGDGVIDGTLVRAENAEIQVFDVPTNKWKKEFATSVDKDKKTLTGFTPHFSLFAAFGVVTTGLDQIRVYPNPYKPNAGNPDEGRTFSRADPLSGVVFDNLPAVVDIKIYTLTGRLVSAFGTTAGTGAVQWDGKNDNGEDVASGGYFAVITSPGQTTVIKKLAVIR